MKVVEVLADFAQQPAPAVPYWHGLWEEAKRKPLSGKRRLLRKRNVIGLVFDCTAGAVGSPATLAALTVRP